jgi:glucan biosynthesis protein C|tara:strand:+ start:901 stop:2247 length:1347 start_codon:yes stop_codon:yes gene_type:complete
VEESVKKVRRYDIDWLRVLLFALLIPFHVGIGVYWDAYDFVQPEHSIGDAAKREDLNAEVGEEAVNIYTFLGGGIISYILTWMHEWRLAALFMISGMGTAFAFKRRTWKLFLKERSKRLLIPMFVGIWTITPLTWMFILDYFPSSLIEGVLAFLGFGVAMSFLMIIPLMSRLLSLGHLWFLWSLFQYSLFLLPIFYVVRNYPEGKLSRLLGSIFKIPFRLGPLILLPITLSLSDVLLKPIMGEALGFGYEWPWYLLTFLFGYIFIVNKEQYFEFIDNSRFQITIGTIVATLAFVWIKSEETKSGVPYVGGGWAGENYRQLGIGYHTKTTLIACFVTSFHAWFWCLFVFTWGAKFLNKPSKYLAYLNQGVYPFYIIHQPIVYAVLVIFLASGHSDIVIFIIGTILVALGCWIFFEITKRNRITRAMYGIKDIPNSNERSSGTKLLIEER